MEGGSLHILMLPWLAFGHLLPFLELSKSLARKGHRISFLTTPRNVERLPTIPSPLTHLITFIEIPLPRIENLPENVEATNDLPSYDFRQYLSKAFDSLEQKLFDLIQSRQITSLDCIIYDYAAYWVPSISAKFGVPCALFSIFKAASLCIFGPPSVLMGSSYACRSIEELTELPKWIPFPSTIVYRPFEVSPIYKRASTPNASGTSETYRLGKSIQGCQTVIIRSCKEFESEWLQLLGQLYEKPIIPIGLLPPSNEQGWHTSLDWLNKQKSGSTVYVAFGSEATLSAVQVKEIAMGLEHSELPFVWALRVSSAPLMESIQDHGRGLICTDWVPQSRILAHPSIGGFLTHAGWSSIIEGLAFGRPMVMMPMIADQPLIARHIVEKGIGIEVPGNEDGLFTSDGIAKTLRQAMVDDEAEMLRIKVKEFMDVFGNQELNDFYVRESVEHIKRFLEVGS